MIVLRRAKTRAAWQSDVRIQKQQLDERAREFRHKIVTAVN